MTNASLTAIIYQNASELPVVNIRLYYASTSRHLVRQYLSNLQANCSDVTMLYRAENHLPRGVPFLGEKYLPHQPAQLLLGESTRIPSQASLVGMRSFPRRLGTEGV